MSRYNFKKKEEQEAFLKGEKRFFENEMTSTTEKNFERGMTNESDN